MSFVLAIRRDAAALHHAVFDTLGLDEMAWAARGLCAETDPEAFFPEKGGTTRDAKRVCTNCEVRVECLQWALERNERFGVWGGLSERERRQMTRRAA